MNTRSTWPSLVGLALLFPSAGLRAQTIGEALDSPGLEWTAIGNVTPLNDNTMSHDGVDVLRIDATTNISTGSPYPSIRTELTVPSVVEFWHRSQDLDAITFLGNYEQKVGVSSSWRKERWLQWPENQLSPGYFEIQNIGEKGSGPLFVDEVTVRPATQVSLAEALDFPGFTGTALIPGSVAGFAEPWLAPDGVDAVALSGVLTTNFPAPALYTFLSSGGDYQPAVTISSISLPRNLSVSENDRTWLLARAAGDYRIAPASHGVSNPQIRSREPVVMDALEILPPVPLNEALDAPGLTFTGQGVMVGAGRPDATGANALLLLDQQEGVDTSGNLSLTVNGPGIVRFSTKGQFVAYLNGSVAASAGYPVPDTWQVHEIPVYAGGDVVKWSTHGDGFWLDAVSLLPESAASSVAGLLDTAPGLVYEILQPAHLEANTGLPLVDAGLSITPVTVIPQQPVFRLHFEGPSLVSLQIIDFTKSALVRIDGGPWQTPKYIAQNPIYYSKDAFHAIVPGSGNHTLEVTGPVSLNRFEVLPLQAIPLSEALDAPGMTFTTSPELPWTGYQTPNGLDLAGGNAAFGGSHATVGDPWIETQVTGPGILKSSLRIGAAAAEPALTLLQFPKLLLDGVPTDPFFAPAELLIGPGLHTLRWVQSGSQINSGNGTLASLDAVSFEPVSYLSYAEALDTPSRTWTVGGSGQVMPIAAPNLSPDGIDSIHIQTDPALDPVWLETMVQLPCRVSLKGKHIQVSTGSTNHFHLPSVNPGESNPTGHVPGSAIIPGAGPALLRFTATSANAVLDAVDIEQPGDELFASVQLGDPNLHWTIYGGQAWQTVPNEATGVDRYRGPANAKIWMETVVNGPGKLPPLGTISLPDHGNRLIDQGWIPYPGPQRVLVSETAGDYPQDVIFRPTPPVTSWNGSPGMVWTTGGDVPWQSEFGVSVRSGRVWPGEISWIESAVTGPGVLFWHSTSPGEDVIRSLTCNDIAVTGNPISGWLHLGPGNHRVRWSAANPPTGRHNVVGMQRLNHVTFTPQSGPSVSSVLSGGTLNFYEAPTTPFPVDSALPLTWPSPTGWKIVDDPQLPGPAVQGDSGAGSLTPILPVPGRISMMLKMNGATYPGAAVSSTLPGVAAPFPWLPWISTAALPKSNGFLTYAAQGTFIPGSAVPVDEALDLPGVTWTPGSNPPGLWQSLSTPWATPEDQDALHLVRASVGDEAWLETTVTGPLRLTAHLDLPTPLNRPNPLTTTIYVDDIVAVPSTLGPAGTHHVNVPEGSHRVRWQFNPIQPVTVASGIAIRSVTSSIITVPDVAGLLDFPGLQWASTGTGTMTALTTGTHDGVDALGLSGQQLSFSLSGPGLLGFWSRGSSFSLALDGIVIPQNTGNPSIWQLNQLPIPHGRHTITIGGQNLDALSFLPLPSLSAETALDTPPGVTVTIPDPDTVGAAAYPGFSEDGIDSLLLMPGSEKRIAVNVPPLSTLSVRVRALSGTGALGFQNLSSTSVTTSWSTRTFSTAADGGMNTIFLRASTVPLLIDKLTLSYGTNSSQYFPWAATAGLSPAQQSTTADPDGDGMTNFMEYAHGLNPKAADSGRIGSDTVPGLPEVVIFTAVDGRQFLEVRFWSRNVLAAVVETAAVPSGTALLGQPSGWTASTSAPTQSHRSGGWIRAVWRSPDPIVPGTRQFARVRTWLP